MGIKEFQSRLGQMRELIYDDGVGMLAISHFNELYETRIYERLVDTACKKGFNDQTKATVFVDSEDIGDLCLLVLEHMGCSEDSLTRKQKKNNNLLDNLVEVSYEVVKQSLSYIHASNYGSKNLSYTKDGFKLLDAKTLSQSMIDYKYLDPEVQKTEYPYLSELSNEEIDEIVKEYTKEKYIRRETLVQERLPHQKKKSSEKVYKLA